MNDLRSTDPARRRRAARELAERAGCGLLEDWEQDIGDHVDALLEVFFDPDPEVRFHAFDALRAQFHGRDATPVLSAWIHVLADPADERHGPVATALLTAVLRGQRLTGHVRSLEGLLSHDAARVRLAAAEVLAAHYTRTGRWGSLRRLLTSAEPAPRAAATEIAERQARPYGASVLRTFGPRTYRIDFVGGIEVPPEIARLLEP